MVEELIITSIKHSPVDIIQSRWIFDMSDLTAKGVHNSFDILVNEKIVGSFSFSGDNVALHK